jgi:hypothetical protein
MRRQFRDQGALGLVVRLLEFSLQAVSELEKPWISPRFTGEENTLKRELQQSK